MNDVGQMLVVKILRLDAELEVVPNYDALPLDAGSIMTYHQLPPPFS